MIHRNVSSIAGIAFLLLSFGCASNHITGQPDIFRNSAQSWQSDYATSLAGNYSGPKFTDKLDAYKDKPLTDRTATRNRIISDLMWLSDYTYAEDTDKLLNGDNAANFIGDIVTLGLTSAATITGGTEAKTVLSGIATVVTGVKTAYDADYLHKQTVTTIINQMNTARATAKTKLVNGLQLDDDKYPLITQALPDFEAYDQSGSLAQAIVQLEQTTGSANATAQSKLTEAQTNATKALTTQQTAQP